MSKAFYIFGVLLLARAPIHPLTLRCSYAVLEIILYTSLHSAPRPLPVPLVARGGDHGDGAAATKSIATVAH